MPAKKPRRCAKAPAKHNNRCDASALSANIAHFICVAGYEQPRAVAAAFTLLRRACRCRGDDRRPVAAVLRCKRGACAKAPRGPAPRGGVISVALGAMPDGCWELHAASAKARRAAETAEHRYYDRGIWPKGIERRAVEARIRKLRAKATQIADELTQRGC